jgi:7-cyano-7-deazaguanine reductase
VSLLGKHTPAPEHYAPEILHPIPRAVARAGLGLADIELPFAGEDVWHAWELSWLDAGGLPQMAIGRFVLPCSTPNLVESKSFKLYLNSLNHTVFESRAALRGVLAADLSHAAGGPVEVEILGLGAEELAVTPLPGECVDACGLASPDDSPGEPDPGLLRATPASGEQILHSHQLRSLCPVTAQPDWASVIVRCEGCAIEPASLLAYIQSYRRHQEFHEQCVERMFCDIARVCGPRELSVQALYTRRGGLDINPFRSTRPGPAPRLRTLRQ